MLLGVDAVLVNVKAAKINFLTSPGAFCTFGLETMFCQQSKHFSDMYDVFRQGTAVNHNIVKVYDNEFAFHWFQDAVHHAHKLAGCVRQAKRQDSLLV
jgi:hypothetical protein